MKLYEQCALCILCGSANRSEVVPLEPMPIATPNFNVKASRSDPRFAKACRSASTSAVTAGTCK